MPVNKQPATKLVTFSTPKTIVSQLNLTAVRLPSLSSHHLLITMPNVAVFFGFSKRTEALRGSRE